MQIPETPVQTENLDLMRRLKAYSEGTATWQQDRSAVGVNTRKACATLHTGLLGLIDKVLARLLDRITAREMETFTMHDRTHGNKVAHLMWHILTPERRERLTPPEIGMLVAAAFLHDVGMALSPDEREARLEPDSDLWERLELDEVQKQAIANLRTLVRDESLGETQRRRAERQLVQAEEVLLSQDTRERHATQSRYDQVLNRLVQMSKEDPERVPDPRAALSFDGDSFKKKLVEVCVSHNQEAESIVESDPENFDIPRFPHEYPIGSCNADLHLIAAALRLADILDFDRERTPPVLFHYLLPGPLSSAAENRSILEWAKHLTIANWHIDEDAVVFRGRSTSHIAHHAVEQFAGEIEKEIEATRATFGVFQNADWPFTLPKSIQVEITAEGYKYVPYRFELDDERVYTLLMGGAIYNNPLVAVRELIQNAVDACKLRDALLRVHQPELEPRRDGRITVTYREPDEQCASPVLVIEDTGTGMDGWILERFFLKVGRSYYRSSEFSRTRVDLRKSGVDFAPVSEFGIGFLSCFLIADQVRVETAMTESIRRDTRKRTLILDGPTRLIRLQERENAGPAKHRGTRISLLLTRGGKGKTAMPPSWAEVRSYLEWVCQDLPYSLTLIHVSAGEEVRTVLEPRGIHIEVPAQWVPYSVTIPIGDREMGFEGQLVLLERHSLVRSVPASSGPIILDADDSYSIPPELSFQNRGLLRGGFLVGDVPGIPDAGIARVRLTWERTPSRGYLGTNIARTGIREDAELTTTIYRSWLDQLIAEPENFPAHVFLNHDLPHGMHFPSGYNALQLYRLARLGWKASLKSEYSLANWENGKGGAIPAPVSGLCRSILTMLLRRITFPLLARSDDDELMWVPPDADWQKRIDRPLEEVSHPVGYWAVYPHNLDHLFFVHNDADADYNSYLNVRYLTFLSEFSELEQLEIVHLLNQFGYGFTSDEPFVLRKDDLAILDRLNSAVGELWVAFDQKRTPIQLRNLLQEHVGMRKEG